MSPFYHFLDWLSKFQPLDWVAFVLFVFGLAGYRFFLSLMLRFRPNHLFIGKLKEYRKAWLDSHSCGCDSMVVIQTMRNTIMCASFLASTAIILMMAAFNVLMNLQQASTLMKDAYMFNAADPGVEMFKILLIVIILSYSFFNFTWHVREINYISFIINIPKDALDRIEGHDSSEHMVQLFQKAGIYFSMGTRGFYFLVPLLMWFFNPILMILSQCLILFILIRRDLHGS